MNSHLIVFDTAQVDKDVFRDKVDLIPSIEDWTLFFGNTILVASNSTARMLSKEIQQALPNIRFLITTIDPERKGGRLPKSLWRFISRSVDADIDLDA